MKKRYDQYCPVAHALGLVGERWALLVVLELMHGPKRYTDLSDSLPGCGTNILASRLRDLEEHGIVAKRTLPPPAASRVYELTPYGQELRPVIRELALWGARSIGPPTEDADFAPGWVENAVATVLAPTAPAGRFEFRVGEELASLVDGEARPGAVESPDAVVDGDPVGLYYLLLDGRLDLVSVEGDRELLERLVARVPATAAASLAV